MHFPSDYYLQATHFCDLARFFGGEIDMESIQAIAIKQTDPIVGSLNSIPKNIDESAIPPERRIPRYVQAEFDIACLFK